MTFALLIVPSLLAGIFAVFLHMCSRTYWEGVLRCAFWGALFYCLPFIPVMASNNFLAITIPLGSYSVCYAIAMIVGVPFLPDYYRLNAGESS